MKTPFVFFITVMIFFSGCASQVNQVYAREVAICLADKGVKEYGAFWCPNCAKQEKIFGAAYKIIKERGVYVECDPRGKNQQSALCLAKRIEGYPTWEFKDGSMLKGVLPLEVLAENAGCEINATK
jgi:hypothetical protein